MQKLYSDAAELIGNTPIVRVNSFNYPNLWAKLEYFNPAGSIKDRVAYNMLHKALERGEIDKSTYIIEPTSGNTGVGLAFCSAVLGLKFIGVMPENMSKERIKLIKAYGAEIVLTPKNDGMAGSVKKAEEIKENLVNEGKKAFIPMQFENDDNPNAHEASTAIEIFNDTDGKVDIVIASIGTGGTACGIAKKLKELKPEVKVYGVEAYESPLLTKGFSAPHLIQGISANFVPKTLDMNLIDKIIDVKGEDAYKYARLVAKNEGLLVGISSGAVVSAAVDVIKNLGTKEPMIITILPDNGERYLSGDLYE